VCPNVCSRHHDARCREAALGVSHPDLTSVIVNLGNTLGVLGESHKKKELLERALAIQQAHFGGEHIEVIARRPYASFHALID